jgi:hypothetical protein
MDNMTRELGIEQEAQPFGRGNIRVGELDEEIRGGIEIQQEKPMVFCAMAMNMDENVMGDDLEIKESMNALFMNNADVRSISQESLDRLAQYKVNIRYEISGSHIRIRAALVEGKEKLNQWEKEGEVDQLNQILQQLTNEINHFIH